MRDKLTVAIVKINSNKLISVLIDANRIGCTAGGITFRE